jgi:hypothetical protein
MTPRISVLLACLGLAACSQEVTEPTFCELPPGFRTWGGTELRLQGFVVGGLHHGFALVSEKCFVGVKLDWDEKSLDGSRLYNFLERENRTGIIRIDANGQITTHDREIGFEELTGGPTFKVVKLHSITFEPMSIEGRHQFFERVVARGRALHSKKLERSTNPSP